MLLFSAKTEDVELTCPESWNARGEKETLECAITVERFLTPQPCELWTDTVEFQGVTKQSVMFLACTVSNIKTVCDGIPNSDGCACMRKTEDEYILQYNITAVRSSHEGTSWRCLPQCFEGDTVTRPLTETNTTACFYTVFGELLISLPLLFLSFSVSL